MSIHEDLANSSMQTPEMTNLPDESIDSLRDTGYTASHRQSSFSVPVDPGVDTTDLHKNLRLLIENLLPQALEYRDLNKNVVFIDMPDITHLEQESREKIPQYLHSRVLTHDNAMDPPLKELESLLPQFFSRFTTLLPELDAELNRLNSGAGTMSILEIRYHKLRQHASALCQHIPGVFRLLDTVSANPTHFIPWELWESRERSTRRTALSVTADEQKKGMRNITAFSKKSEPEKQKLMIREPELASMLKLNSLMNLASWEERSARQRLVPTLLASAKALQTAIQLTQGSAKNLHETVWISGKARGLYTPSSDTLEGRAYQLAKTIEVVCIALEKLAGMLAGGDKALAPETMLQEYGDDTGMFHIAAQEVKTEARVFIADPLPGAIKVAKNQVVKNFNKLKYKAEFAPLVPEQEAAILRVGIILSDRLEHLQRNVALVERDALLLQLAIERKAVAEKLLSNNVSPGTMLDSALRHAPAIWQENIAQKRAELQANLAQIRTLPESHERPHFIATLRHLLKVGPVGTALPEPVQAFSADIERWVNGMGEIEDAITGQVAGALEAPSDVRADFRVSLATWGSKLGNYQADVKAALASYTGLSAGNTSRSTLIAKGLAEHLQHYKREYLHQVSHADRKEAGQGFNRLAMRIMTDYAPLLLNHSDAKGVSFLQRFEIELNHAATGNIIYPTTMAQILAGMKSLDVRSREWALKQLVRRGLFRHIIRGISLIPEWMSLPVRLAFRVAVRGAATAVITLNTIHKGNTAIRMGQGGSGQANREFLVRMLKEGGLKTLLSSVPGLPLLAGIRAVQLELGDGKPPIHITLDRVRDTVREIPWQLLDWATRESVGAVQAWRAKAAMRQAMASLYGDESELTALENEKEEEGGNQKLTAKKELQRIARDNPRLAVLAKRLLENGSTGLDSDILRSDQQILSHYNLQDRKIRLSVDASDGEMLHEIAHAMTAHQLRHGQRLGLEAQVNKLNELRLKASAAYVGNDPFVKHYLGNLDEFVAGLYSGNDVFTAHLKSLQVDGESLFSRIVKVLCQLLGIGLESESALTEAMELSDQVMEATMAEGEDSEEGVLYSVPTSVSSDDQEHQINTPRSFTLQDPRFVGRFDEKKSIKEGIPPGFKVQLIVFHRDAPTARTFISVPEKYRAHTHWQEYVSDRINNFLGGVKAGVKDNAGAITPLKTGYRNFFYVESDSNIKGVSWSLISDDTANDSDSIDEEVFLGLWGNYHDYLTLNRKTEVSVRIDEFSDSGQMILWDDWGAEFDIDVDTLLSKDESNWTEVYENFENPKVIIEWTDSFSPALRALLRDPEFIKKYRRLKSKGFNSPPQQSNSVPAQQNALTIVQAPPEQTILSVADTEKTVINPPRQERVLRDFDHDISYQNFTDVRKKHTYVNGIKFILSQIYNDTSLPLSVRTNAHLASIGAKLLVPVDIGGYKLNNTVLLPNSPGGKHGVLIRLDSKKGYYYVSKGSDLLEDIRYAMPYFSDRNPENRLNTGMTSVPINNNRSTGFDILNRIRNNTSHLTRNFNKNNPEPMSVADVSEFLFKTIDADYALKRKTVVNSTLIARSIAGAHLPDPGITATEVKSHLETTTASLTTADYLRAFGKPFSALSGDFQLIISSHRGETIQDTELHMHQAEYIGSWVDATVGAAASFTPAGWVFTTAQSTAEIAADLLEGKDPDPLAVAGVLLGCIPGEKIAAKVGKFSAIGSKTIKYGLMIGNKVVDLSMVARSIKAAVDTGDPLAIYQALMTSGMSIDNSYRMTIGISSALKIGKSVDNTGPVENAEKNHPRSNESDSPHNISQPNQRHTSSLEPLYAGPSGEVGHLSFDHVSHHGFKINAITKMFFRSNFSKERISSFSEATGQFQRVDDFTIAHTENIGKKIDKIISKESINSSLNDMGSKVDLLVEQLNSYQGPDKEDFLNNLQLVKTMTETVGLSINDKNNIFSDCYVLARKNADVKDINNHYAIAELKYLNGQRSISVENLMAHPYVIVNKYPAAKAFLIKQGVISSAELKQYNIKNVARYLGGKAVRTDVEYYDTVSESAAKSISFNAANPITQKLGCFFDDWFKYLHLTLSITEKYYVNSAAEYHSNNEEHEAVFNRIANDLKSQVRSEFLPTHTPDVWPADRTEHYIDELMNGIDAEIIHHEITDSNIPEGSIRNFSREAISATDKAYEKVSAVKSIFERAETDPVLKSSLKELINQATGLNDEDTGILDNVDTSVISDMAYNRFKYNVDATNDYLGKLKKENYNALVLFEYKQFDSSKALAYALPFDSKKRILLTVPSENGEHHGLDSTVIHEATHNAVYTLDHTYLGNIRNETGSFPPFFDSDMRATRHFNSNDRLAKLSTKYVFDMPEKINPTPSQINQAGFILQYSKLVKSDTLLNSAEYNTYMIDVLSNASVNGSEIELNTRAVRTRNRREVSATDNKLDDTIMLAALKIVVPGK